MSEYTPLEAEVVEPDLDEVRELEARFTNNGRPAIADANELLSYSYTSLRALLQLSATYVWPTTQLIDWLKSNIPDLGKTIEIGSGNGVLAGELGIPATDSYLQSTRFEPKSKAEDDLQKKVLQMYELLRQQLINYGPNVEQYDAVDAVMKYRPKHVLGCYITHRFREGDKEGNALGVNEEWILKRKHLQSYFMVGNKKVHNQKPILAMEHEEIELDGLITGTKSPEDNRIFIWRK